MVKVRIYWLQFLIAALWAGIIDAFFGAKLDSIMPELRIFVLTFMTVLAGILAFEPISKPILKLGGVSFIITVVIGSIISIGRRLAFTSMPIKTFGGPLLIFAIITVIIFMILRYFRKDSLRF